MTFEFSLNYGNQMISSAIWNKYARANVSKTIQKTVRARRSSEICSQKNLLIYSKLHEKNHLITC